VVRQFLCLSNLNVDEGIEVNLHILVALEDLEVSDELQVSADLPSYTSVCATVSGINQFL
jgi:hypothetical protein